MVPWRATGNGEVTENVLNWYGRFAKGKPGAIVVEATGVRDIASGPLLRIGPERYDAGLRRLVERVRKESGGHTRLFIQLIDFLTIRRRVSPSRYFGRFFVPRVSHFQRLNALLGVDLSSETDELELRKRLAEAEGATLFDKDEASQITIAKQVALPMMMDRIRDDLAALGVTHSHFLSEKSLHDNGAVDNAFETLQAQDLIYHGVLEPPKGKKPPPNWESKPQWLFRSQQFGDDSDRALKKSDGSWTYFAPDIAYHFDKFQRGFSRMIDVWGSDHIGYIKRMQAAVSAITRGAGQLDVKVCNLVKLQRGGAPVKMSKRSGNFITLREVVDEVGRNAVRFMMLTRRNDATLDFDFDLVKQQSRDNPVFYVQYAHARIHSVLRNAEDIGFTPDELSAASLGTADSGLLTAPEEIALAKVLGVYPRNFLAAAIALEPHRLAFYLQDLAAAFHGLWTRGKEDPSLRFIQDDNRDLTAARLALLRATEIVLANGLDVIGVEPETEMR